MSVIIVIHRIDEQGKRTTFNYSKPHGISFANITQLEQLFGEKPQVYQTGMGAMYTQKCLVNLIARLNRDSSVVYELERIQADQLGQLTAASRIEHGRTPAKYG